MKLFLLYLMLWFHQSWQTVQLNHCNALIWNTGFAQRQGPFSLATTKYSKISFTGDPIILPVDLYDGSEVYHIRIYIWIKKLQECKTSLTTDITNPFESWSFMWPLMWSLRSVRWDLTWKDRACFFRFLSVLFPVASSPLTPGSNKGMAFVSDHSKVALRPIE